MSYTALSDTLLLMLWFTSTSTIVAFRGSHPLLPVGLMSVGDVEPPGRSRLNVSLNAPNSESISISPRSLLSPTLPASDRETEVLPRRRLVKSTRPSFKPRTPIERLKSALASYEVHTHQEIRTTITVSRVPTVNRIQNSLLKSSTSIPRAARKNIVLLINDVRPANSLITTTHAQSSNEYGRLYRIARVSNPRALRRRLRRYPSYHREDVVPSERWGRGESRLIGRLTTSSAESCGLVLCCRSNKRPITTLPTDVMMER